MYWPVLLLATLGTVLGQDAPAPAPAAGGAVGGCPAGKITGHYTVHIGAPSKGNPLACATHPSPYEKKFVAVTPSCFSQGDSVCQKCVRVTLNGKSVVARIQDKCMGCGPDQVDMSPAAANELGTPCPMYERSDQPGVCYNECPGPDKTSGATIEYIDCPEPVDVSDGDQCPGNPLQKPAPGGPDEGCKVTPCPPK
ncbi:hypothetical protein DdX_10557 [Ditylenchus destructor]|uniref:Uncharacterized protein n=1 Tax=Ditylenchus destructor TaxID=166010 RepID=A0AAD4N1Y3_9BILA|nr:hypothetical protein DdX_10557 [Ditylenchus destructor]